jgi:hypothetical protein
MDATAIRRYLQPSPTLRWHPWAPLIAGLLLLGFVFYLGTRWGFNAGSRFTGDLMMGTPASDVLARHHWAETRPAHAMLHEAGKLDAAVRFYDAAARREPGVLERWRDRSESIVFFRGMSIRAPDRQWAVKLAEFRLAEYSPANPRWNATAALCDEMRRYARSERDLLQEYQSTADDYTTLLGRTVRPQDVAPAVPGWKCSF